MEKSCPRSRAEAEQSGGVPREQGQEEEGGEEGGGGEGGREGRGGPPAQAQAEAETEKEVPETQTETEKEVFETQTETEKEARAEEAEAERYRQDAGGRYRQDAGGPGGEEEEGGKGNVRIRGRVWFFSSNRRIPYPTRKEDQEEGELQWDGWVAGETAEGCERASREKASATGEEEAEEEQE